MLAADYVGRPVEYADVRHFSFDRFPRGETFGQAYGGNRAYGVVGGTGTCARRLAGMTAERYAAPMAGTKRKVTLYVDEDVLRAARVRAARTDKRDSEVVEAALRAYLGFEVIASVWARSDLGEDEAMRLAVEETHAVRAQRRAARGS